MDARWPTSAPCLKLALGFTWRRCLTVPIARWNPCANRNNNHELPRFSPAGLTQYVLNHYTTKSPSYHAAENDVSAEVQRLEVDSITGQQSVRG